MQTIGIVAEYNPFHCGHQYHIAQSKLQCPEADGIIAVMSGNFTQRGEPAIFDKWTRTKAALHGGADLVLELPTAFATRSAGYFARGAVLTLAATGIVSHLSCGVENTPQQDMACTLQQIAALLADEPEPYREALQHSIGEGMAYPQARQKALQELHISGAELLDTPNNILALEYLQNIASDNLPITPLLISRAGNYHAEHIPTDAKQFASATAIRKLILEDNRTWRNQMPDFCSQTLSEHLSKAYPPMHIDDFLHPLLFLLRRTTPSELQTMAEMTEGLENRILEAAHRDIHSVNDLCMAIKSKRYTYTRIQRTLLHILLNFTEQYAANEPTYIRVLGFNAIGQKMLKEMKKKAQLPVLIRPARQKNELSEQGHKLLDLDVRATNLYYTGYQNPALRKTGLDYTILPIQQ